LVFLYHFLRIGPRFRFFAYQHVLLHKEGHDHKGFYKFPLSIFNNLVEWWIGPFYGQVPNSYAVAHNKIHHRYDNGLKDVHTNLDLDRTKLWSFLTYVPRFGAYWSGFSPIWFFATDTKDTILIRRMLTGMIYYYGILITLFIWDYQFALAYYLFPHFEAIIFFGSISYLWHAFVDPEQPSNAYVNSVTIINGEDNIFNEDYHVVHHNSPLTHWTDYIKNYEEHIQEYIDSRATVFRDTEEGIMLYWMFSGKWDTLAEHFVDLQGKLNTEQKKELLLSRLAHIVTCDKDYTKKR